MSRTYALEHFSNAGGVGQRGGTADVRGTLATQAPPTAEECPLPPWRGLVIANHPVRPQPQQFLGHFWDAASPGR